MTATWQATGSKCSRRYTLFVDGRLAGVRVCHCGHPTALWPYYIETADTEWIFIAPTGRAFHDVATAKEHALALVEKRCTIVHLGRGDRRGILIEGDSLYHNYWHRAPRSNA